ncbi:unnamed protein product [Rhizophagus irregularis]|nr:unnamed protein product [Rhizophagus irregularis]
MIHSKKVEEFKITIMRNEILKLFINKNTKFIGLYIPQNFSYPIHLIFGAEYCLSTIEYLSCDANTNQSILKGLSKICKSIKKLRFDIIQDFKMVELIKAQKNLNDIYMSCYSYLRDELYCNNLEESLIKNSDTIQYLRIDWTPITQTLSLLTHMINPDPWKGRHPMLLQIIPYCNFTIMLPQKLHHQLQIGCLIKDYEANGTIEKYDVDWYGQDFEDFKWVQGESITYFN